MTKKIILTITLSIWVGFTGCSNTPEPIKYNINKDKQILHIENSFELYKKHKSHKAMAVAMDKEGKYVIGYSFDCASMESAKQIALDNCTKANAKALVPADTQCVIYAVEDEVITTQ